MGASTGGALFVVNLHKHARSHPLRDARATSSLLILWIPVQSLITEVYLSVDSLLDSYHNRNAS